MFYKLSEERAEQIAECIRIYAPYVTAEDVTAYCTADWPEGEEHQLWLDTAPVDEIADWCQVGPDFVTHEG